MPKGVSPQDTVVFYLHALKRPVEEIAEALGLTVQQAQSVIRASGDMKKGMEAAKGVVDGWIAELVAKEGKDDAVRVFFKSKAKELAERKVALAFQEDNLGVANTATTDALARAGYGKQEAVKHEVTHTIQLPEAQAKLLAEVYEQTEVVEAPMEVEVEVLGVGVGANG